MKKLILAGALFSCMTPCVAQKMTSDAVTLQYNITPVQSLPSTFTRYKAVLITPINLLTKSDDFNATVGKKTEREKADALAKAQAEKRASFEQTYLGIDGKNAERSEQLTITLTTGKLTVTNVNNTSFSDLGWNDEIFRYRIMSTLMVTDNTGKVWLNHVLTDSTTDQIIRKQALYNNPLFAARAELKSDEKIKKIYDSYMKNHEAHALEELLMQADKVLADQFELQRKEAIVAVFGVKGKAYADIKATNDAVTTALGKFRALSKKNQLSKADVDKVFGDAQAVWEKCLAQKATLEEKAVKGLILNMAFSSAWRNELDKADSYLAQIPEVNKPADKAVASDEDDDGPDSPGSMGAVIILSLEEYASNLNKLVQDVKTYKERLVLIQ